MSLPTWQPDSDTKACFLCSTPFTLFNRRHHCRKCGRVVCASCSAQHIKYFPNSRVLLPDNLLMPVQPFEHYRTCDECVEEMRMIRQALFESPSTSGTPLIAASNTPEADPRSRNITKCTSNVRTVAMDLSSTLSHTSAASDDNLCPVCGIDLLKLYVRHVKQTGCKSSHDDYESFKEAHVNECLVAFDFGLAHQRLSSPPGASLRNRMLVYNIPPFPKPSYEIIEPGSVDTLQEHACGLVTSTSTMQLEKAPEQECVICLEELKPGDKVGRLECLCVFHYKCIKDWFNKKGYGECPVHYMHH